MKKKIDDIRKAVKNGTYYCALALALTLPDICCHVGNGLNENENADRSKYIGWVNDNVDFEDFHFSLKGFGDQTFSGEMCYSLRCKVLHNGNIEIYNPSLGVNVDKFVLTFPNGEDYYHGYQYEELSNKDKRTSIGIDYLCESLCDAAEKFYDDWPNKKDFDKFSF